MSILLTLRQKMNLMSDLVNKSCNFKSCETVKKAISFRQQVIFSIDAIDSSNLTNSKTEKK